MEKKKRKIIQLTVIFLLAFIGGYIDVFSLLSNYNYTVSHATGNASKLAKAYFFKDLIGVKNYTFLLLSFLLGAVTSGYIIGNSDFKFKRKYGYMLIFNSSLLFLAKELIELEIYFGILLLAYICGLQNSLIIKFDGALVRTTHLTGTLTDLGANIGNFFRTKYLDTWRFLLNNILIFGFITGGFMATYAFYLFEFNSLRIIAFLYLLIGSIYNLTNYSSSIKRKK